MIDNYDSFTFNIVQYLGQLGEVVQVYRNDKIKMEEIRRLKPQAIFLSPGPCTPREAGITVDVIREFYKDVPIMGICLGHQSIGYAFRWQVVRARALCTVKLRRLSMMAKQYLPGSPILFPPAAIIRCLSAEKHCLPVWRSARKRQRAKLWDCGTGIIRWKAFSSIRNRC